MHININTKSLTNTDMGKAHESSSLEFINTR